MPFDDLAAAVRRARRDERDAADAVAAARERLKRADAARGTLNRVFDPENEIHAGERERLDGERDAAAEQLVDLRRTHDAALAAAADAIAALEPESDPRKAIGQLDDGVPILLVPVRLETRFADGELLVRVYPDDCSIDSFEDTLSETEVESARLYWIAFCEAGGIEDQQRGAWRGLVAAHGSGRAQWIVQSYRPLNFGTQPPKVIATDVVLTVASDTPLPDEQNVAEFWEAMWLADGRADASAAALDELETQVGSARAEEVMATLRPANFDERPAPPLTKEDVRLTTGFVVFPPPGAVPTKTGSWTRAPRVAMLPDRFVFVGYAGGRLTHVELGRAVRSPLIAGPDPSAPPDEQLKPEDGDIVIPEPMRWMVDFDAAVEAGMGLRVPLGDGELNGFDRVLVIGLRVSEDEDTARDGLETLLEHHRLSRTGLGLVPQGTPTNNTEDAPAGLSRGDDSDASFDDLRDAPLFADDPDWRTKRDGQWLAEHLGIDPDRLRLARNAGGRDQADARAMNIALWPATLGYWIETMMAPVLGHDVADVTREFFTRFVSGAGAIPAIRIGRQPYGICPATAFSRLRWPYGDGDIEREGGDAFIARLYEVVRAIDADWAGMSAAVSYTGKPGDAHRTLLDIVGLHPGSVEWSQRWAESLHQLYNRLNLQGLGWLIVPSIANRMVRDGVELLRRLGYTGEETPDILEKLFFGRHNRLTGTVVDDVPLSETEPVRDTTTDGHNYLEWLATAAGTSLDALYRQDGFVDEVPPRALLYLMLRHALQLGYHDVGLRLHESAGLLDAAALLAARRDRSYIHVEDQASVNESRYGLLYAHESAITGSEQVSVGEFIGTSLGTLAPAEALREQVRGIERLAREPTARLERTFADHVDCCSYRLDAWRLGLVHFQLAGMRNLLSSESTPRQGVHVGAYAWLEDLRPEARTLEPVTLPDDLAAEFEPDVPPPLLRDSANQGYIHAPSLNQAVAAAVLRNGYTTNQGTAAVNLTSERVRRALGLLEGIRAGQSLGALLGYQLERGLHDRHAFAEVDEFILDIRRAFPLRADRLKSTSTVEGGSPAEIEAIEARNVVDGLALVEHIAATNQASYPFGLELPDADPPQAEAIDAEVERLLDSHDAVADLALAEGVYQAVLGNYDRVASTYDAYAKGNFPPEPDVVRTPGRGIGLTHRVALHLEAGLDATVSPFPGVAVTPRAHAEPSLNRWLADRLPPPGDVGCRVTFLDAGTGSTVTQGVTLADLDLQPADLVALLHEAGSQAMAELDDRVVLHALATFAVRHDEPVTIAYMETDAELSVFELLPLVRALRPLVTRSRPLRATDLALTIEAAIEDDAAPSVDATRIEQVLADMAGVRGDLATFLAALQPLLDDTVGQRAVIIAGTDARAAGVTTLLVRAAAFGALQAGWGFVQDFRRRVFTAVLAKCDTVDDRWTERLAESDAIVQAYVDLGTGGPAEERFALLLRALRLVSTAEPATLPADPEDLRTNVVVPTRAAFAARRDGFRVIADTSQTTIAGLLAEVQALLPVAAFDLEPVDLVAEEDETVRFAQDCAAIAGAVHSELGRRIPAGQDLLDQAGAAAGATARVDALTAAAKALLGEDFVVVPEFGLQAAQGAELTKAVAAGEDGTLLSHLNANDVDFPVDTWLYGAARVREKLRAWEAAVMYSGATGRAGPELTPLQLPYRDDDRWLALEFPPDVDLGTERLLYTAHFATPFDASERQCGLLLDEWSEVIPAADADTGLAFHYDRPNSEAPQAMLLVTPAAFTGRWGWDDLVDALHDTLDLAKRRAVEPLHVDASPYAPFLPATVMAMTVRQLTISANLALNNDIAVFAEGG